MTFSLTVLGSSSAMPTPQRNTSAQVLNVLERFFLIDCGEGTQIQMRRFRVPFNKINHVLISHLHGDHFLGIYGFISSLNLLARKNPLHLFGPPKLKELLDQFIATLDNGLNYELVFHPHDYNGKQLIYEDKMLTIESFPLRHRISTCGFVFKEKERLRTIKKSSITELSIPIKAIQGIKEGNDFISEDGTVYKNKTITVSPTATRSFAYVSDTAKHPGIVPYIEDVDLLYHEATFADEGKKRAKSTGHSTARQAAQIASKAKAKKLIIGHFSNRYKDLSVLLNEAKEEFENTEIVKDGSVFSVPLRKES